MNQELKHVFLYGTGGHADVVAEVLSANGVSVAGIFDDDPDKVKDESVGLPGIKLAGADKLANFPNSMLITIGSNWIRHDVASQIKADFPVAIHPSALVSNSATIGEGTIIIHRAIVQAKTRIGRHAIINTAANVDHDCVIGDFTHVSPNATLCGNVSIGEGTQVGAGATIIPNLKIGKWCMIGAGAVIIRDVPDFSTVVGVPGRIIKTGEERGRESIAGTAKRVLRTIDSRPLSSRPLLSEQLEGSLRQIVNQIRLIAGQPAIKELTEEQRLQADLQLDSLQLAELTVLIEAKYGVDVFADGIVATVGEVAEKIEASGGGTE